MSLLFLVFLIFLLLFNSKSKFLYVASLVYMWIIFGWNNKNPDKEIYEGRFYNYDQSWLNSITEPLYTYTILLFHNFHITFQESYVIVSFFFLLVLSWYIGKVTTNRNTVLALMLISIYAMIVVLFRTTYAITFILIATYILLYSSYKSVYRYILYILLVIVASLIHSMCLLYLPFLFIFVFSQKTIKFWLCIYMPIAIIGIGGIATGLLPNFMEFIGMSNKMDVFLGDTNSTSNKTIQYILALLRVISVVMLPLGLAIIQRKRRNFFFDLVDEKIISLNWLSLFIVPLLYISHDLYRIMYVVVIVNFCMASKYIKNNTAFLYTILCTLNIAYWFIWRPYFEDVFISVYTSNLLF